jgi:ubiquinone/menaquinone biosynthesis C-methylase UbiE
MEHNRYHDGILDVLLTRVEPKWKVLDIGGGSGVLSMPLCAIGCDVTVLEPSIGMRNLLYEEAFKRGIDWLNVDERKWEDIPAYHYQNLDLIVACNSLHLTKPGFEDALERIFLLKPKQVFLITECCDGIVVKWAYEDYTLRFTQWYETESSFAYHHMDEALEHWAFKKGRMPLPEEESAIRGKLTYRDDHLWMQDIATVGMFWWERER